MDKKESRYFNTAAKMDMALIELLGKKDFEYITIREICETAGVHRSTFYLHYDNIVDLLNETTKYITDSFQSYFAFDRNKDRLNIEKRELEELVYVTPEYINPYLNFVKENMRVFKTSINHLGTMNFDKVYKRMFEFVFNPILDRFNYPKDDREYVMRFYLSGITAIVMEWLKNDCKKPIEEVSRIIIHCTLGQNKIRSLDL